MESGRYKFRRAKTNFRTQQISIRGFTRELKSLLLNDESELTERPQYSKVADAFIKHLSDKVETIPNEDVFINSSGFSYWWRGLKYPNSENKRVIDSLFPGLTTKWFDRSNFKNRMQLHLASLDLFHISSNCKCTKPSSKEQEWDYCNECLLEAINEAESILRGIHKDWQPEPSRGSYDVCISGPDKRSDPDSAKPLIRPFSISKPNEREKIDYDLSLGDTSYIGLDLPKEIFNTYQAGNYYSVVLFLFLLLGLDIKTKSEYRNDLVLDFMTALNCAGLLLYVKHKIIFCEPPDFIENKIQKLLIYFSDSFYDEPFDLEQKLSDFENVILERNRTGGSDDSSIVYSFTHVSSHPTDNLANLFLEVLDFYMEEGCAIEFMRSFRELCHTHPYEKSIIDDYIASPRLEIFKSLAAGRERYLKQFDIVGYSREELAIELSQTLINPLSAKFKFNGWMKPKKKSIYS